MQSKKIGIIGGGASGLFAATMLSKKTNASVYIFEKNDRLGKKLSQTGNGQGNLSNRDLRKEFFHSSKKDFFLYAIEKYGVNELEDFYNSLGIFLTGEKKLYPLSKQASAVTDTLRNALNMDKVNVYLNTKVDKVKKAGDKYEVYFGKEKMLFDYLIMAFGGKAAPFLGTDGSSYDLVLSLSHKLTPTYPSVVMVKTANGGFKSLKGIKTESKIKAVGDGEKEGFGDILFTDYGLSGSAIFSVSPVLCRGGKVYIDLLPSVEKAALIKMIDKRIASGFKKGEILSGIVHNQLARYIYNLAESSGEVSSKTLCEKLKQFTAEISSTCSFDYAQVTRGGIDANDIDDKTMESKINKNLFIIGEALDVDGDCGGYNLHFAFSSAALCTDEIKERLKG